MAAPRTRMLTEAALSVALAVVFNYVTTVWQMPQGGAVSLEMLPIIVLALRRGPRAGLAAGAVYGVFDLLKEPFVVHPVQFLLDYPLPYALVGLAGLGAAAWSAAHREGRLARASAAIVVASGLGILLRYLSHVVSGAVFFGEYAPKGQPVILYSAAYNLYVIVAGAVCVAAALVLLPALERVLPSAGDRRR